MINRKNHFGKVPAELGVKDALHVAIVSVRAGQAIKPGQSCDFNEHREAVPSDKGVGVADPFRKGTIFVGESFWLLMRDVEAVEHHWEHKLDFSPPEREPQYSRTLLEIAKEYGVTYQQLMEACRKVVETDESQPYPGSKTEDELDAIEDDELWYEWADETGYEFENVGSACCPEYQHPECDLFEAKEASVEQESK